MPLQIVTTKSKHRASMEIGDVIELFYGPILSGSGYADRNVYVVEGVTLEQAINALESKKVPWREESKDLDGNYYVEVYLGGTWVKVLNMPQLNFQPTSEAIAVLASPSAKNKDKQNAILNYLTYRCGVTT